MVVQDAGDAAGRFVQTRGCAGRVACCTTAFGALEGAAGFAVLVFAFEARKPVAAMRNRICRCVAVEQTEAEG